MGVIFYSSFFRLPLDVKNKLQTQEVSIILFKFTVYFFLNLQIHITLKNL